MAGEITENDAIYQLLISADNPEVVAALQELVNNGMSLKEAFDQVNASASKTSDLFNSLTSASGEGIQKSTESVRELTDQLTNASVQATALKEAMAAPVTLPEQSYINQLPYSKFQLPEAGAPPPEAVPGEGGPPPEMQPVGSMFGVGHALSVAGFMTGMPGLKEAGAVVYLEEGLKRVMPLFENLNTTVEATPGLLAPLVQGFTALGLPMAGLLAAAAPLAIAVAGVVVAIQNYNNVIAESKAALQGVLNTQDEYYKFIQTATTKEAQDKVATTNQTIATQKQQQEELVSKVIRPYFEGLGEHFKDAFGKPFEGTDEEYMKMLSGKHLIGYDSTIMAAIDKYNALGQSIGDNTILVGRLNGDLLSNAFATNDANKYIQDLTNTTIKKAQTDEDFQKQLNADTLLSVEGGKARLKTLQDDNDIIKQHMQTLKPFIETNKDAAQQYDVLDTTLKNNINEIDFLSNTAIPAAQHVQDLADATKALDKETKDAIKAHDDYVKSVQTAQDQITNQAINARAREYQNEQQYWAGSIQDAYQRDKIITDESRKETELTQDTANSIVDIRTKLSQKESDAMTDYNRKVMDDQTKYLENKQGAELDTYRKERDNLQSHYDKLADIQNKEAVNQQDALLNRNFLQLAQQKDNRQKEIDAENLSYDRRQRDAQTHLQDQEYDLKVHLAEERTQQFVEYQRKLVDDRQQTQREIDQRQVDEQRKRQVLQQSEVQQLNDLSTAETYKLQLLRQGLSQELQMYELQNQQRLAILDRDYRAAQSQALSTIQSSAAAAGTPLTPSGNIALAHKLGLMDSGGPFEAGVPFMKGDISELFNFGGGKSYAIPGAAVVMPLQGGTATPQGGNQFNFHIPVNVNKPGDAAFEASRQVYQKMMEALGEG